MFKSDTSDSVSTSLGTLDSTNSMHEWKQHTTGFYCVNDSTRAFLHAKVLFTVADILQLVDVDVKEMSVESKYLMSTPNCIVSD